jgi:hypothetical protein
VVFLFYLILALALLDQLGFTIRLRRLPIGRAWEALREDEVACRSLGINTDDDQAHSLRHRRDVRRLRRCVLRDASGLHQPGVLHLQESALILAIVVLGGMGSQLGVALAAFAMIGGFELFRGARTVPHAGVRLGMVLLMIWRPRGLIGHRAPTVFLQSRTEISSRWSRKATDDQPPTATFLQVEHLSMRFGGIVAVNDLSFTAKARRDHRADRPQRRRQDHGLQLHHRLLQADIRHDRAHSRTTAARFSCWSGCSTTAFPRSRKSRAPSRTSACSRA